MQGMDTEDVLSHDIFGNSILFDFTTTTKPRRKPSTLLSTVHWI